MPKEKTLILDSGQIAQKLVRIAHEIFERHHREKEIAVVGIAGRGNEVAKRLAKLIKQISPLQVSEFTIELSKAKPLSDPVLFSAELKALKNKPAILVDDVLNSGRTMIYAAKHLLDAEPKSLTTVVLVDRFHRTFPIRADYVGLTLSTNMKEHISVEMEKGREAVYLE